MGVNFFSTARDVFLEVEINENTAARFEIKYRKLTGVSPSIGFGYQHQNNKWGGEYRIYFNSSLDLIDKLGEEGIYVESGGRPYRSSRNYRINNKEFFWALISAGYRLGEN